LVKGEVEVKVELRKYVDFSKNYDSVTPACPIKVSGKRGRQTDRETGS